MSLLIATPCYAAAVTAPFMQSMIRLGQALVKGEVEHDFLIQWNDSLIQRCRNNLVRAFVQETSFQKLMFIDADIEFDPADVAKLWNMNEHLAVGIYSKKKKGAKLSAWTNGRQIETLPDEPFEVDYAGTGFMLIDRAVFETLRDRFPEREHIEGDPPEKSFAWFDPRVIDGFYASEDYAFCRDWRESGGRIIADPSIKLIHHGQYGYGA